MEQDYAEIFRKNISLPSSYEAWNMALQIKYLP